ncbi:unnamed protein product, partial [Polarella glacialis]
MTSCPPFKQKHDYYSPSSFKQTSLNCLARRAVGVIVVAQKKKTYFTKEFPVYSLSSVGIRVGPGDRRDTPKESQAKPSRTTERRKELRLEDRGKQVSVFCSGSAGKQQKQKL